MASQKTIDLKRDKMLMRLKSFRTVVPTGPVSTRPNRDNRREEIKRIAKEHGIRFQDAMKFVRENKPNGNE